MENHWEHLDIDKIDDAFRTINGKAVFGIDGYVDEVWEVVEHRSGNNDYIKYSQMVKFGELIVECSKGGISTEIVRKRRTYGGFTANTGYSSASLGMDISMIGLYGRESTDPVFKAFERSFEVISVGDPAVSYIMEFDDGKLMLVDIKETMDFNWKTLLHSVGYERLKTIFSGSDIIALGYWSNMPTFDDLISRISEHFLDDDQSQRIFLDLADIRKRDGNALYKTMDLLAELNKKYPITLSLNVHEAEQLFSKYKVKFMRESGSCERCILDLQNILPLDEIIVHTPQFASASSLKCGSFTVIQRFCEKPVRTTAAGDNFNGGYIAAHVCGLDMWERLSVANAAARTFLRLGHSANRVELVNELRELKWAAPTPQFGTRK